MGVYASYNGCTCVIWLPGTFSVMGMGDKNQHAYCSASCLCPHKQMGGKHDHTRTYRSPKVKKHPLRLIMMQGEGIEKRTKEIVYWYIHFQMSPPSTLYMHNTCLHAVRAYYTKCMTMKFCFHRSRNQENQCGRDRDHVLMIDCIVVCHV